MPTQPPTPPSTADNVANFVRAQFGALEKKAGAPQGRPMAVDFDGVVHAYTKGWTDGTIYDPPVAGAFAGLAMLMSANMVHICSTREPEQILEWMAKNAPEIACEIVPAEEWQWTKRGVLGITNRRLTCAVCIDDRGIRFTNWPDITNLLA